MSLAPASVAVLSFSNSSRHPADDWIGDGIAETVSIDLTKIGLTVVGLGAPKTHRVVDWGHIDDTVALEVPGRLGAVLLVRGSYRRVGDRLRITAQVVDVASGQVVHHARADSAWRDLFVAQDQIVAALAEWFAPSSAPVTAPAVRGPFDSRSIDSRAETLVSPLPTDVTAARDQPRGGGFAIPSRPEDTAIRTSLPPILDGGSDDALRRNVTPVTRFVQTSSVLPTTTGVQTSSSFYFRGIIQETGGAIVQPFLETGLALYEGDSGVSSVNLTAGTWSSLHTGPSGSAGASGDPRMWYEADFYASLGVGLAEAWSTDVTYTAYMSPNQSFETIKELALGVSYDDGLFGPYATMAVEIDGQGDGGLHEGTYLELGVEPGLGLPSSEIGLSFPVAVGLSVSDYFEGLAGDETFGFLNVGAIVSVPLTSIPARLGSWEVSGGINFLVFGDALKSINGTTDDVKPIGIFGLSLGP